MGRRRQSLSGSAESVFALLNGRLIDVLPIWPFLGRSHSKAVVSGMRITDGIILVFLRGKTISPY